jgi:hypothetical protein
VDACIKDKQEASGFPSNCITESDKDDYIFKYYEREGILLDKNKINKNNGARQVAKLRANSQWGFLAMQTNKTLHKFVKTKAELHDMLTNDQFIIHNIEPSQNGQIMQVFYSYASEMHYGGINTNVAVAAFVTSYARLKLYKYMDLLGERCLYVDTDSIIYVSKPGEYDPPLGDYLGEFTNEIDAKEGNYIDEFVSAGPKNYAYKLDTGITHCTVKGFTLNHIASLSINYDSIKNIVCEDRTKKLNVRQVKFTRNNKLWEIYTENIDKLYGFVYDKRILYDNLTTKPYGF